MSKLKTLALGLLLCATPCLAQTTNQPPPTALETIETATGILVLRSSVPVGSLNTEAAIISVTCKQDNIIDAAKNPQRSFYGCSLTISANANGQVSKTLIDADEMGALLHALENIRNVTWSITSLPSFDLTYTTKAGLTVSGFSSRRNGQIEFSIKSSTMGSTPLTVDQVGQLYSLLQDAKTKIDNLRKG